MRSYQQVASKALKTLILQKNKRIRQYIPQTMWYEGDALLQMLSNHSMVYLKPDKGGGGGGIIRIQQMQDDSYQCCNTLRCTRLQRDELISQMDRLLASKRRYIIQQGIRLLTIQGNPFDLRILMQKPASKWEVSGMVAKIGAPDKIVTNYCKGGRPYNAYQAIWEAYGRNRDRTQAVIQELHGMSLAAAEELTKPYRGLRELGIDVGLDQEGRIWIFEINTRPQFRMFRQLKDLNMYYQIKRNHRQIIKKY